MGKMQCFIHIKSQSSFRVLIYDKAEDYDSDEDTDSQGGGRRKTKNEDELSEGTIIFCCPNAGYYEYMYCDVRILDFQD